MKYLLAVLYTLACICIFVVAYPYPADHDDYVGEPRNQKQSGGGDHHDVVDFGAHTGDHGAFGWYADFPVHAQAD